MSGIGIVELFVLFVVLPLLGIAGRGLPAGYGAPCRRDGRAAGPGPPAPGRGLGARGGGRLVTMPMGAALTPWLGQSTVLPVLPSLMVVAACAVLWLGEVTFPRPSGLGAVDRAQPTRARQRDPARVAEAVPRAGGPRPRALRRRCADRRRGRRSRSDRRRPDAHRHALSRLSTYVVPQLGRPRSSPRSWPGASADRPPPDPRSPPTSRAMPCCGGPAAAGCCAGSPGGSRRRRPATCSPAGASWQSAAPSGQDWPGAVAFGLGVADGARWPSRCRSSRWPGCRASLGPSGSRRRADAGQPHARPARRQPGVRAGPRPARRPHPFRHARLPAPSCRWSGRWRATSASP